MFRICRHQINRALVGQPTFHPLAFAALIIGLPLLMASPLPAAPLLDSTGPGSEINAPLGLEGHGLRDVLRRLNAGEIEIAIAKTKAIIEAHGESAAALELLGVGLALGGHLDLASAKLERAIELNPEQSSAYTKLGDIASTRGDHALAEDFFRKAVALNDDDRRAHQRLGVILETGGAVDSAILHLEKGLIGLPQDYVGVKVNLARLYNLKGDHQEALGLLEGKLSPTLDEAKAFVVRGTSKLGLGEAEEAVADFETAKTLNPNDPRVLLAEGIAFREAGRIEESQRTLKAANQLRADWSLGLFQLAMTERTLGDHQQAVANLDKALAIEPVASASRIERARYALEQGGLNAAVTVFEQGWPADMASPRLFDNMGQELHERGDLELAEAVLIAGTGLFVDHARLHHALGHHYGLVQRDDDAVISLEAAAERAPDDPAILKALSMAYQRQGNLPLAIGMAATLAEIKDDVEHHFYLAALRDEHGQKNEAKRLYHDILSEDAGHISTLNNLAVLLLDEGEAVKALGIAERATMLAPKASDVIDTLGMALLANHRGDEAVGALERANALTPDDPLLLYHLGLARHRVGDINQASALFEQALNLSMDFKGVEQAKALLDHRPTSANRD